jgi:hypothetical protein
MHRTLVALVAVATLCMSAMVAGAEEDQAPDATLELTGGSVAAGIGFSWGSGTLTYKGKEYPVSVSGLSVGSVGITSATASGKVFSLKELKDFDGTYTAVGAGLTAAGGGAIATMKNQNGVTINLVSTTQGVKVTLGTGGVSMKIKDKE